MSSSMSPSKLYAGMRHTGSGGPVAIAVAGLPGPGFFAPPGVWKKKKTFKGTNIKKINAK